MREFLLRAVGAETTIDYGAPHAQLKPIHTPSRPIAGWGCHRIEVEGEQISFSDEPPGIQVSFVTGKLSPLRESQIMSEIAQNYSQAIGHQVEIVDLGDPNRPDC